MDVLHHMPLVQDGDIGTVREYLDEHGVPAFLVQPWSGIPYKVWGVVAGVQHMAPWQVIPAFIAGRALRMTLVALAMRFLVGRFHGFFRDYTVAVLPAYILVFSFWWWWTQVVG